jgi:hypothetical protein
MLRTTPIKYLISWVSIATVVCKNKRLKYVMLMDTDDKFNVYSIDTDVMVMFYYLPCLQDVNNNLLIPFMFIILLYLFSFSIIYLLRSEFSFGTQQLQHR